MLIKPLKYPLFMLKIIFKSINSHKNHDKTRKQTLLLRE